MIKTNLTETHLRGEEWRVNVFNSGLDGKLFANINVFGSVWPASNQKASILPWIRYESPGNFTLHHIGAAVGVWIHVIHYFSFGFGKTNSLEKHFVIVFSTLQIF